MIKRHEHNPLFTASMVKPSHKDFNILGIFNPGATTYNGETILITRIAENCKQTNEMVRIPYFEFHNNKGLSQILNIPKNDPTIEFKDTRGVLFKGVDYLTTLSQLRIARSTDGINFTVDDDAFIIPCSEAETFGIEDARISKIDGRYYINYTGVSKDGFVTALSVTDDFKTFEYKGVIFPPMNKDVAIFEEKVHGKYIALHRPLNIGFGKPSIWYAESYDLVNWGNHKCVLRPEDTFGIFDVKIGAGAAPIKTEEGWLEIYHGVINNPDGFNIYALNVVLLDFDDPAKVIKHSKTPLLYPTEKYETGGFVGNVIFSNGHIVKPNGEVWIYYGACDDAICLATTTIKYLLSLLK